jgi:hypothetical protein
MVQKSRFPRHFRRQNSRDRQKDRRKKNFEPSRGTFGRHCRLPVSRPKRQRHVPAGRRIEFEKQSFFQEVIMGRGILLWFLGIPIPIIILIMLFWR